MRLTLFRAMKLLSGMFSLLLLLAASSLIWIRYNPPALPRSQMLGSIVGVKAISGRGQITITWDDVPGATGYQVVRSDKPDGDYYVAGSPFGTLAFPCAPVLFDRFAGWLLRGAYLGRVPRSPFVDTAVSNDHTYYYRVRATDGAGWVESTPVMKSIHFSANVMPILTLEVDASKDAGILEHKWEVAIGSERLSYLLRGSPEKGVSGDGLREALDLTHTTLGVTYVIAHGILMDDLGVYHEDPHGTALYDWSRIDKVYDTLHMAGLKPFVQLDFMPLALASDRSASTIWAYKGNGSPPKDYAKWRSLVAALASHLIERYGKEEVETWPFEVWNQPDICLWWRECYWTGTYDDYFHLYDYAVDGLKAVDQQLKVGGPVVALSRFVEPFLQHVTTRNYAGSEKRVPLDFLDVRTDASPAENWRPLLIRYGFGNLPIYYTEWGIHRRGDPINDAAYSAAWVVHGLYQSAPLVDAISYWCVSDYSDEVGPPRKLFHGGLGILGVDGLRKPRYWAYYLLRQLGSRQLLLRGEGDGFGGLVTGWATRTGDYRIQVLLSNVSADQTSAPASPVLDRHIVLRLIGLGSNETFSVEHFRIDNSHSNVYRTWHAMGEPAWPSQKDMSELHKSDVLETLGPKAALMTDSKGQATLEFEMPMPSVSLLVITPATN